MSTFLYILYDPDKPHVCKIGITKNPTQRIKAYKTAAPRADYTAIYPIPSRIYEKNVLNIFKDIFKVESELVRCPPTIAQNIIESYLSDLDLI